MLQFLCHVFCCGFCQLCGSSVARGPERICSTHKLWDGQQFQSAWLKETFFQPPGWEKHYIIGNPSGSSSLSLFFFLQLDGWEKPFFFVPQRKKMTCEKINDLSSSTDYGVPRVIQNLTSTFYFKLFLLCRLFDFFSKFFSF